jgi:hypothetical protein
MTHSLEEIHDRLVAGIAPTRAVVLRAVVFLRAVGFLRAVVFLRLRPVFLPVDLGRLLSVHGRLIAGAQIALVGPSLRSRSRGT